MSGAAIEGSDPRRAVMAFLEGANFIFHHSSVLCPAAPRLDEAVGNHELGCANGDGVHAERFEYGGEVVAPPGL